MKVRRAFTLVELVVVILVLGILAAVAAPKFLNVSHTAVEEGLKQTLTIVRDALELYQADNGGTLPPCTGDGADFRSALAPYLRGEFPTCPVGPAKNYLVDSVSTPVTNGMGNPAKGWKFNTSDGTFICNYKHQTDCDPSIMYDEL